MKLKKKVKNWAQNLKEKVQIRDWLNKITVLRRVQLGFVVVVAILLIFSLLIFINTAQIADELYSLNQTLVPSVKTNTAVTNNLNNKMMSIYKWQANLAPYTSSDMLGKELDNLKSHIQQEDVKQRLNKMEQLNAQMKEKISQLRKTEEGSYENKNLSSQIKDLGTKLKMNNAAISKFGWQQLEQRVNSIDNKAKEIRNTTLLLALISLVFCLLLAFGLYIGISKITTNIKNKSYQAKDKSESIDALSSEIKEIADEVDSKISNASVSIQELVAGNQEVAEAVAEVTKAISEVSTGVEELAQQAEEISQIGEETYQFMEETTGKIVQGDKLLDTAVKRMKSLEQSINKIGSISNKIMEISEQTNLLALNAAIEAARAGEKGKGFSVVAEEIKELADESKEATLEVQKIIQEIEASTKQTVEVMTAEEGDTENIVSVFNEINYLAQDVAQQMKKVKEAAGNQVASTEQVSALTQQISVSSEEMAAQTETAVSSTKEISDLMGEVNEANDELYDKVNDQENKCNQQEKLMNLVIEANQKLNKKD